MTTLMVVTAGAAASTLMAMWARAIILGQATRLCWSILGCLWSEVYLWNLTRPAEQGGLVAATPQQVESDTQAPKAISDGARARQEESGATDEAAMPCGATSATRHTPLTRPLMPVRKQAAQQTMPAYPT
jgi:hypothetical protein